MKLDERRCRKLVADHTGYYFSQCERPCGHGPDGHYCKRHAVKMNRQAAEKKLREQQSENGGGL